MGINTIQYYYHYHYVTVARRSLPASLAPTRTNVLACTHAAWLHRDACRWNLNLAMGQSAKSASSGMSTSAVKDEDARSSRKDANVAASAKVLLASTPATPSSGLGA